MRDTLHPELQQLLDFFLATHRKPPEAYAIAAGLLPSPQFFSVAQLQQHLNNPLLAPDWVHLRARGQTVPLDGACLWKTVQTRKLVFMDKQLIDEQLRRGAAIVLEGLDILDERINAFTARVDAALPCALINCVAFFSQRGNEAYGGHRDSDDVLVVQVAGAKRWHIFAPQQRRHFGNAPLTREQMGREIADVVLHAGDALYLRAGVPHSCETPGEFSLHLSFDLCDRTPNIEQITHEANARYNQACADTHAPATDVVDRYVKLLQSPDFSGELTAATRQLRDNATAFRERIGRSAAIRALDRFATAG
jgi:hypothetical protein